MKKVIVTLLMICALSLTACSESTNVAKNDNKSSDNNTTNSVSTTENDSSDNESSDSASVSLVEPTINWTYILTNTGIPTLLAELTNTNSVPIDITMDITFYKNDSVYSTETDWYCNCIAPGETKLLFGTPNVPLDISQKVDFNFTYYGESMYEPVDIDVSYDNLVVPNGPHIDASVEGDFSEASVRLVYYNGETPVAYSFYDFYSGENGDYDHEVLENYDSAKLYAYAYKYK